MKVAIASKNPVKIACTESGFKKAFPSQKFEFIGIDVESGVSDQPMTEEETLLGATNRARNVLKKDSTVDFAVGIESGIKEDEGALSCFAWIVTITKKGKVGKGRTGTFYLPESVSKLIREGKELGEADDIVFKRKNSKQLNGSVGILTKDIVSRQSTFETAVVYSLIPFMNPTLY